MKMHLLKLEENRVRRNYTGGAVIDRLRGKSYFKDDNTPEEWICSLTEANNPGMEKIPQEGLSNVYYNGSQILLKKLFEMYPDFYLGKNHVEKYGVNTGFLVKLLDSSIRLHLQAHPTKEFAKKYLNSDWGKFECYYILSVREGINPYIRLGFQNPPTKEQWKKIIETQDIDSMDNCFLPISVAPGDVLYIPGGMPHAIGEGILMVEIMEPSDLVVRCEFEREGIVVPEKARFMNKNLDFCLDIFNYDKLTPEEIHKKYWLHPEIIESNSRYSLERLVGKKVSETFEVFKLKVSETSQISLDERFIVGIVYQGDMEVIYKDEKISLNEGDSFFIASETSQIKIVPHSKNCEICLVTNVLV